MILTCGYLIIEKRDEIQFSQIKGDWRISGGIINSANLPKTYPTCYKRIESFDSHFCDSWIPCNVRECIEEYEKWLSMHHNQLKKIKEGFEID